MRKDKCSLGQSRVNYLGHIIGRDGVSMDPEKILAMMQSPQPTTLKRPCGDSLDLPATIGNSFNTMGPLL
jgi:hypothetical protein